METDEEMALIACRLVTLGCTNVICIRTCEYPDNREHENTQRDLLCTLGDGCYQIRGRCHSGQPNSCSRPEQVVRSWLGNQSRRDTCHRLLGISATDSLESSQCPARLRTLAQFTMVTQHGTAIACSECGRGGRFKSSVTLEFYDGFLCFLGERPDGIMLRRALVSAQ